MALLQCSVFSKVQGRGLAVVMPEVHSSFYTDMQYGSAYFRFIAEELPYLCSSIFRIATGQENTFVAGPSMGGYGATKFYRTCGTSGFLCFLNYIQH